MVATLRAHSAEAALNAVSALVKGGSGQAAEAAAAGARFLVSPGCADAIVGEMTQTGVLTCPGAFTPTEVMRARALGADVVKLFPASLSGPQRAPVHGGGARPVPSGASRVGP